MGGQSSEVTGPDLTAGIAASDIPEGGILLGQVAGEQVVVTRQGDDVYAVGATCTHYGGPLGDGLVVGKEIRCPWHHACFDLRTGEAVGAPALNPIACYRVEQRGKTVYVRGKTGPRTRISAAHAPRSVVIVGAGAAGHAAAEALRAEGYDGPITLIGAEATVPVDRPNLSKDYLAGNAPEDWIPLRSREYFAEHNIDLHTGVRVTAIHTGTSKVELEDGRMFSYEALLLAPGAEVRRLDIPGADGPGVFYLRTLADCQAIIARATGAAAADDKAESKSEGKTEEKAEGKSKGKAEPAKSAVVIGASFIGLEVAASLRSRDVAVTVVAPEEAPLARILGDELGAFVKKLHEDNGVVFKLGRTPRAIAGGSVELDDGSKVAADMVVVGVGVTPRTDLAKLAGCQTEDGILVDDYLHTSVPGIWAAGDAARYPDRFAGSTVRIEHWVVAQRQGQRAARNMLGQPKKYLDVPFFWSQHYDVAIGYVGHAAEWDEVQVYGSIDKRDCVVVYRAGRQVLAAASIFRDRESLAIEAALGRGDQAALERVLAGIEQNV